jgi:hypothetical protein
MINRWFVHKGNQNAKGNEITEELFERGKSGHTPATSQKVPK